MTVLTVLIPASLLLGLFGLLGFLWMLRHDQFDDPEGQAMRILSDRYDDRPAPDSPPRTADGGQERDPEAGAS